MRDPLDFDESMMRALLVAALERRPNAEEWQWVPKEPTEEMLTCIVYNEWPADWERGKKLQRERGLKVVPPVSEYEWAVGQYQRLLSAAPLPPDEKII